ncbi:MAG: helix-turn-helix transcriptional regulator [Bacteroidales bacterium]|nr:helix-turn-helix transcriptional regulator [Bacteroidales bacterium]
MLRPHNAFSAFESPVGLRRWTAAFVASMALSHVWWLALRKAPPDGSPLAMNAIATFLDTITLVPLAMIVMLRMLQDRCRPLWGVGVAMLPIPFITLGVGVAGRNPGFSQMLIDYLLVLSVLFFVYMGVALFRYGRWLRDNYADLEHKKVWQVFLMEVVIFLMFYLYKYSGESDISEFSVQVGSALLTALLLWRVETLPQLDEVEESDETGLPVGEFMGDRETEEIVRTEERQGKENLDEMSEKFQKDASADRLRDASLVERIDELLKNHCETPQLYLQYDLTLTKLCAAVGTNRTYLSAYFRQKGITYNTYINKLRIEHFMNLCREAIASDQPFFAREAALLSGYQSYRTFTETFKKLTGMTATEWIEREKK